MRLVRGLTAVLLMLALVLAVGGCTKKMRASFKGMFALRKAVQNEFGVNDVGINITSGGGETALTVSLVNSDFNNLARQAQAQKAQEVADFVSETYKDYSSLTRINVAFLKQKNYLILHFSNTVGVYSFVVPKTDAPETDAPETTTETI